MNGKTWTANPLLLGLLLLALGVPCAFASAAEEPQAAAAGEKEVPKMSPEATMLGDLKHLDPPADGWFIHDPTIYDGPYDAQAQLDIYGPQSSPGKPGKHMNRTANPPVDLGIRLYDRGAYEPRPTWLGAKNPINSHLMAYGDLRVGAAYYDNGVVTNGKSEQSVIATRLNLDMDLALTATERIHAFVRPLDRNGSFTRYQISGGAKEDEFF